MERIMNEETKKKMRGLLPYSDKTIFSFTPSCYNVEGVEDCYKPVFKMRGLTRSEHMELVRISQVVMEAKDNGKDSGDITTEQLAVVRSIIVSWENVYSGDGELIPFSLDADGFCNASVFFSFHFSAHIELIIKMYEVSGLSSLDQLALK